MVKEYDITSDHPRFCDPTLDTLLNDLDESALAMGEMTIMDPGTVYSSPDQSGSASPVRGHDFDDKNTINSKDTKQTKYMGIIAKLTYSKKG